MRIWITQGSKNASKRICFLGNHKKTCLLVQGLEYAENNRKCLENLLSYRRQVLTVDTYCM
jgi:hypothetical protein